MAQRNGISNRFVHATHAGKYLATASMFRATPVNDERANNRKNRTSTIIVSL